MPFTSHHIPESKLEEIVISPKTAVIFPGLQLVVLVLMGVLGTSIVSIVEVLLIDEVTPSILDITCLTTEPLEEDRVNGAPAPVDRESVSCIAVDIKEPALLNYFASSLSKSSAPRLLGLLSCHSNS